MKATFVGLVLASAISCQNGGDASTPSSAGECKGRIPAPTDKEGLSELIPDRPLTNTAVTVEYSSHGALHQEKTFAIQNHRVVAGFNGTLGAANQTRSFISDGSNLTFQFLHCDAGKWSEDVYFLARWSKDMHLPRPFTAKTNDGAIINLGWAGADSS